MSTSRAAVVNQPRKHHYIPAFYTRRWCTRSDCQLSVFSRPFGNQIKALRKHPEGTGWADQLYALEGFPEDIRQAVEQRFFSPIDSAAAEALAAMESGNKLSERLKAAWTTFLVSLLLRMPEDIAALRSYFRDVSDGDRSAYYAARTSKDPETIEEILNKPKNRRYIEREMFRNFTNMIQNEKLRTVIFEMEWKVRTFAGDPHNLLSSDRPIIHSNGILKPECHLALPIGPTRLFVASSDREWLKRFAAEPERSVVKIANRLVVSDARRFVFATDEQQSRFINQHFGTDRQPSIIEALVNAPGRPPIDFGSDTGRS